MRIKLRSALSDKETAILAEKIRLHVVKMTSSGKSSHVGSALSIADILAVLYGKIMDYDPKEPMAKGRDKFILSKGHAGAAVYAVLAEMGFFSTTDLENHYQNGSVFSGHVSHKGVPGVELSTGSLGHGLGVGVGLSLSAKFQKRNNRTFVLLSDGELDEGSNWEALLFAAHHKLDNLIAVIDYNKLQSLDSIENTLGLEPLGSKFSAFNWHVEVVDGHCHQSLGKALLEEGPSGKPKVVICNTTKGKGVSFMENQVLWHYRSPQEEELSDAITEIQGRLELVS
ncbi:transketolase [Pseudomonadales bacterium]|nr:transketolase [Pseudomonadales bacterium]